MAATSDQNRPVPARSRSFEARDRGWVSVADTSCSPKALKSGAFHSLRQSIKLWEDVVVSAQNGNGSDWRIWLPEGKLLLSSRPEATVLFFLPVWGQARRLQRQIAAADGVVGLQLVNPGGIDDLATCR